jgi:nitroreductase
MMLAAWNEGIGSCIASLHDERTARDILGGVPADHGVRTAISFGYPAPPDDLIQGRPRASVLPRLGRRPLNDLAHWEQWTARA